jgi:hypothetical protein
VKREFDRAFAGERHKRLPRELFQDLRTKPSARTSLDVAEGDEAAD